MTAVLLILAALSALATWALTATAARSLANGNVEAVGDGLIAILMAAITAILIFGAFTQ